MGVLKPNSRRLVLIPYSQEEKNEYNVGQNIRRRVGASERSFKSLAARVRRALTVIYVEGEFQ